MRSILYILAACLIWSCSGQKTESVIDTSSNTEAVKPADHDVISLHEYGYMAEISLPNKQLKGVDASINMNDMSGFLDIRAGKGFHMNLREEPLSLEELSSEFAHDLMWTNTLEDFSDKSVLIQKTLPDGTQSHFHFVTVHEGIDGNMILRSDPMGEFTKRQVEAMLLSAESLSPEATLAETDRP